MDSWRLFSGQKSRALIGFALLFLGASFGCDKSTGPNNSPEGPGLSTAPSSPSEEPAPPPESHREPQPEGRDRVRDPEPSGPQAATESGVPSPSFSDAATPEFKQVFLRLDEWVQKKGGRIYGALVDLSTDEWLFRSAETQAVNPASNAKLVTAAAVLELLGTDYQFQTALLGNIDDKGHASRLVLRGGGAPDLTTPDLWRLIQVALGRGLGSVQDIVVDQSRFSEDYVPPAFEQQPGEWAPFRAPISALSLNGNAVSLNVFATKSGEGARVWYDPPGIVVEEGRVLTSEVGKGDQVSWSLDPQKDKMRPHSRVGGQLAEGLGRRRYSRRLEVPRLAPGLALRAILQEAGVKVLGTLTLGQVAKEENLATWTSKPASELIRAMGKESDNFVAEMMLVALSDAQLPGKKGEMKEELPWSSKRGAEVVSAWLKEKGILTDDIVVKNGSGLFNANRLSAELITKLLASLEDNPRVYQDFVSHLAIGATDGTLENRMKGSPLAARIRAKTGTLRNVDALSGYIQRPMGKPPAAFSLILVNTQASHAAIRAKVDESVLKCAEFLE
jgi:D-alanyl-D-alanine carboxypeptidase/D-alanyl-D-alanine-endopeptidase (penicillin-binding protein 4)